MKIAKYVARVGSINEPDSALWILAEDVAWNARIPVHDNVRIPVWDAVSLAVRNPIDEMLLNRNSNENRRRHR